MAEAWTPEATAAAIRHWKAGRSAGYIAAALKGRYTRSAILGKLSRLKLLRNDRRIVKAKPAARPTSLPHDAALAPALAEQPAGRGISWITAPANVCVNVIGDPRKIMICGKPKLSGGVYCLICARINYNPAYAARLERAAQ